MTQSVDSDIILTVQAVEEIVDNIRSNGGRVTPQKVAVIEAISQSDSHPTVDELFEQVQLGQPTLSRKTVYQIVYDLQDLGAISLVDIGTGQLRIDPTVEHSHDHFVCSNCNCVFDIVRERKISPTKEVLSFGEIESVDVVYRGLCRECTSN